MSEPIFCIMLVFVSFVGLLLLFRQGGLIPEDEFDDESPTQRRERMQNEYAEITKECNDMENKLHSAGITITDQDEKYDINSEIQSHNYRLKLWLSNGKTVVGKGGYSYNEKWGPLYARQDALKKALVYLEA